MKVCIIGLGYIGFPTACVVAKAGHEVVGMDINIEVIDKLKHGGLHIVDEEGLSDIVREVFESQRLRVTNKPERADVFILAVPTPYRKAVPAISVVCQEVAVAAGGHISGYVQAISGVTDSSTYEFGVDLSYVEQAARSIIPHVSAGNLIILESTVLPATTNNLVRNILEKGTGFECGKDIYLAHAPERVFPGNIIKELTENGRIIGGVDPESTEQAVAFYRTFVHGAVVGTR
ncbi:MAG: hypothetical protein M1609_15070 [Firmicutes bacterium]|nr:hypothetical protein [Bacillota bacterium]